MEKQEQQTKRYERKPTFDMRAKLSRDGRYWIIERIETWILPANYLAAITKNHAAGQNQPDGGSADAKPKKKGKRDADSNG
jgi:hypothetical protein